jgi:hypothetical protein
MSEKYKPFSEIYQRGNAMIYVLIIVALFGALSFVLTRQSDTGEAGVVSEEQIGIHAAVIQNAASQLMQSVEQMRFSGSEISDLNFITPDDPAFDAGSDIHKVFHPSGGGATLPRIPNDALNEINTDPPARWYIGRFNNFEWTPTTSDDVVLTAHQISENVCASLNQKLTGSPTIPELTTQANRLLIDASESSAGSNINFTSAQCNVPDDCYGKPALCVKDFGINAWSFYSLIVTD